MKDRALRGVAGAPGVAVGPAYVYRWEGAAPAGAPAARAGGPPRPVEEERARFQAAVAAAAAELERQQAQAEGEARDILAAHRLILDDPELHRLVEEGLAAGQGAEAAVKAAVDHLAALLAALDDPYLRERAQDVRDVGRRLLRALTGAPGPAALDRPAVVVARELTPGDTIGLDRRLILGIVTEQGGPTSHTCILARAWGIPAVVGVPGVLERVETGMPVALDGGTGEVVLDPGPDTLAAFQARAAAFAAQAEAERAGAGLPAETLDGRRIELAANAGSPADVAVAMERGAEGIGLLRSEFLFMGREAAPSEEEQTAAYAEALALAGGRRVIIRTLDVGGDKPLPYLGLPPEENPFLGLRALRLCLRRPDLFRTQLRALLRAAAGAANGRLAILFPMVGGLDDLRRAKEVLAAARESLASEGQACPLPEVGIMVEVPSAALSAEHLAPEVDFFSIGTNDLVQYTLAVDRGHPDLADLYQPYHPAVLHLIARTVAAAHAAGKWVGVCGEMAGEPEGALLLLGLGVDELSVGAVHLPAIRRLIRSVRYADAAAMAQEALRQATADQVRALARDLLDRAAAGPAAS